MGQPYPYSPNTRAGRRLLAHELAHTVQQDNSSKHPSELTLGATGDSLEREADAAANGVLRQALPPRPTLTRVSTMIQRQDRPVEIDLETTTPQEIERLRDQGVQLPSASAQATSPRAHSDFIDRRCSAVGYGIYLFGYLLFCEGVTLPVHLPDAHVNLALTNAAPINNSIYPDRESALADFPIGPRPLGQPYPFAYYRAAGGLVVPTVFSPATTPRTVQTMLAARRQLAQEVQHDLVVLALSLVGGLLVRALYSKVVRAGQTEPAPGGRSGTPTTRSPVDLGKEFGAEVAKIPAGKRAALATRVTQANLSQADAVTATGEASKVAFGRIAGTVKMPNGDMIVPSVQTGPGQPIFVVRPNGQVLRARATISANTLDPANALRITDIELE
jgi:hypothetical protein